MQIRIRWGDLGSPTQPGEYRYGLGSVRVRQQDIDLSNANPNAVFIAVREEYNDPSYNTPYLLTKVEFPDE
jgi:hypothetical protein